MLALLPGRRRWSIRLDAGDADEAEAASCGWDGDSSAVSSDEARGGHTDRPS